MIIGGKLIKLFLKMGYIYCSPAPQVITENSLDITLGQNFWRPIYTRDEMDVDMPAEFQFTGEHYQHNERVTLLPGKMILGHTTEFVGSTVPWIVPQIRSRSTAARWGIECGTAALFGEGNFHSRWTLELHNTIGVPVSVLVGARVGQIVFTFCLGGGMYRRPYNADIHDWTPKTMLPKAL